MPTIVNTVDGDLMVRGGIYGATVIDYPAASIVNADVAANAAIAASKCQRSPSIIVRQTGTVADETIIAHFVKGATGTLKHFTCSNLTPCNGASYVTVDLQKNGVSVLAAVITLDLNTAAFTEKVGVLTTTTLADGDYLTVVIDATQTYGTDTMATGVFAQIDLDEDYAS